MNSLSQVLRRCAPGIALMMLLTADARADRYRVQVGSMPAAYINDSATYCSQLGGQSKGVEPRDPGTTLPATAPSDPPPTGELPPDRDHSAGSVAGRGTEKQQHPDNDQDTCADPPTTQPIQAFLDDLRTTYNITDQANITAVWKWFEKEPANLSVGDRTGNSVVHQILANDGPLVPTSTAQTANLNPDATSGRVRSGNGVVARDTPWGTTNGSLGSGATVTITPPANGMWYNVEGVGWVPGLWLDLN